MPANASWVRRVLAGYRLLVPAGLLALVGTMALFQLVTERSGRLANVGWVALGFGVAGVLIAVWLSATGQP